MTVKKQCTLSCYVNPKKKTTKVQKRRIKTRKLKYKLLYTGILTAMLVLKKYFEELGEFLQQHPKYFDL